MITTDHSGLNFAWDQSIPLLVVGLFMFLGLFFDDAIKNLLRRLGLKKAE